MALQAGYRHDIFVSDAHNDNQPLVSGEEGWVRTLINLLRVRTIEKVGSNALDIWMDYDLSGNSAVTPTITDALTNSSVRHFRHFLGWNSVQPRNGTNSGKTLL